MERRVTDAFRKKASVARYWHAMSVKADLEIAEASGDRRAAWRARKNEALEKQRRAVAALDRIKLTAPVTVVARTAGVTIDQARHALRTCDRKIKSRLQG
jgi:hypothetical protein